MALWYKIYFRGGLIDKLEIINDMVDRPDMRVLAFDIGFLLIGGCLVTIIGLL